MTPRNPDAPRTNTLTSLVFPTFNPGSVLERTWTRLQQFLRVASGEWEVLFVCDGCTDGSPARLAELVRETTANIRVLSYSPNRGKGFAVRCGLQAARGSCRVFTDVDLAYSFEEIERIVQAVHAGAPVAIASRTHPESRLVLPTRLQGYAYRRSLQSQVFSGLVRLLLPVRQRDTQAGLKGISASVAQLLVPQLGCDGFGLDCELLTACARYGIAVAEVPVCVSFEDRSSTTNLGTTARMLRDLWRIRRAWRCVPRPGETVLPEPERRRAA